MQKLEKKHHFPEAIQTKDGNYATFFKYGKNNTGKDLPKSIITEIEENLNSEMKELGYL